MKKVMIIGGLGFIGSYLAEECVKRGYEVTIVSRSESKIKNVEMVKGSVKVVVKDLKDVGGEVKGFDYIFNLAGSTDNYSIIEGEPYKDIDVNCNSTIALLEACKEHNPKARIIFASTFFVNGRVEKLPVTPESKCSPLGLYGATRLAAEQFCHIYHNIFDLDVVILRFSNVFGPREQISKKKAGFNFLVNLAVGGEEIPLYDNGDFFRDYIFVTDVVDASLVAAEKGETNKVYYVARGEFVKFKELIDIVVKETGVKIKPITPPDFHKRVGIKDFVCDVSGLKGLGWEPKVSLDEGIKRTVDYYRKELG